MQRLLLYAILIVSASWPVLGQNVSSSVKFSLEDPTGAPVPNATCTLTSRGTGVTQTAVSLGDGSVSYLNVLSGSYDLSVRVAGFKTLEVKEIAVAASEIRTLGRLTLQIGEVRESVNVTAETSELKLASAERAGEITNRQVEDIAVKGRDFMTLLRMVPGVVDDMSQARETTTGGASAGLYINGNRSNQKNPAVDGITNLDTGSNNSMHFQPNMDVIAEVKVMTSNFQAEFGRNGGGVITVITKSGSRDFHGSGYSFYRHESLNANSFFNNRTATPKSPYRYRISGYTIGGPVFLPGKFNTSRDKLFFFWSQEYVGQRRDFGTRFVNMPTEIERRGDFSRSFDVSGALLTVKDPVTGQPFPGNVIPQNRLNKLGQAMVNYFPLPNYVDSDPRQVYARNYRIAMSGPYPKREDLIRLDANFWPSLQIYYRYVQDKDEQINPYGTGSFFVPYVQGRPGYGHVVHVTKVFSPTLINEFIFGLSHNNLYTNPTDRKTVDRGLAGNPPKWFMNDLPYNDNGMAPDIVFGGQPSNAVTSRIGNTPYYNWNDIFSFVDNVSKSWGSHNVKAGTYIERTGKHRDGNRNYRGEFNFSRDTNNPFDSGHSFANAMLGNFQSYTEATSRINGSLWYWNAEFFVQDNWRVNKRLTLDIGLRVYHMPPMIDKDFTLSTFDPAFYDIRKAPVLYAPAKDASGRRVARDPLTGTLAPSPLIGQFVPGSGDAAVGSAVGGKNGYPPGLYTTATVSFGPRFGFAYDLFGNGRTALRGGFGMFKDRGIDASYTDVNPPLVYSPTLYYGNLDTFAQSGGAVGPSSTYALYGDSRQATTMNFSFGVQQQIGKNAVEVSYVGNLGRHLFGVMEANPLPMYARFEKANEDPTQPGKPLADQFLRPYRGYQSINLLRHDMSSNYNSLQVTGSRRMSRGFMFGVAYTFSKALGVGSGDKDKVSAYFPLRSRDYGPLSFNRAHVFVANYSYDLPKPGKWLGSKPLGWILDEWQVSGITMFMSGAPFTPGMATTDGQDITGSSDGARITVVGNARLDKSEKNYYRNFNTEAFARTPLRSFGNAGVNILTGPGINNWDLSISKRFSLGADSRYLRFRTELFNAWNHTQFSGLSTTARFDPAGKQTDPNFGAFTAARDPRRIQLSLKVIF